MIKETQWKNIREEVWKIHPNFAEVIDELDPSSKHPLYLVEYPYGALIVDKGTFQVPNPNGIVVPIDHSTLASKIQTDLGYSGTIPLGLVMDKSIESFMLSKDRVIPSAVVKQGQFISLWRVLEEESSYHLGRFWNISSGVRSICMVPKITDACSHKTLKSRYGLKIPVPQKLFDHWELFINIANHKNFSQQWKSTVLFFSKQWLAHKKDKKWDRFYRFLLNTVWQNSSFRRNQFIFDFAFSRAQENRNLRPNPYLSDTVRHLIAVGSGAVPGFTVALDNDDAPIAGLQRVYIEEYGLKKYAPVLMHLHHFSQADKRKVYYSFQIPTTTIFSPKSRKLSSAMSDLHEVKYIMEILLSEILKGNLEVENTPLFELAKNVSYGFYHTDKDKAGEISLASNIKNIDKTFTKTVVNANEYAFPEFAPFFRGCASLSYD